jgi:hypothetical protein
VDSLLPLLGNSVLPLLPGVQKDAALAVKPVRPGSEHYKLSACTAATSNRCPLCMEAHMAGCHTLLSHSTATSILTRVTSSKAPAGKLTGST